MSAAEVDHEPKQLSAADMDFRTRRAAARRLEFLDDHQLRGIPTDGRSIVRMCDDLAGDWKANRVHTPGADVREAIPALNRLRSRYGSGVPSNPPARESFGSDLACYAHVGTDRPVLATRHVDELGPDELRELDDFRRAGFELRLIAERWVVRAGFRVLIANRKDLVLNSPPGPDPEYRPGPNRPAPHVKLRSSAPEK